MVIERATDRNILRFESSRPSQAVRLHPWRPVWRARRSAAPASHMLLRAQEYLVTEGAKVVSHGRYVTFQMAEVAIPRQVFQEILRLITELRPQPPPAPA
jgi:hypothetical protein